MHHTFVTSQRPLINATLLAVITFFCHSSTCSSSPRSKSRSETNLKLKELHNFGAKLLPYSNHDSSSNGSSLMKSDKFIHLQKKQPRACTIRFVQRKEVCSTSGQTILLYLFRVSKPAYNIPLACNARLHNCTLNGAEKKSARFSTLNPVVCCEWHCTLRALSGRFA